MFSEWITECLPAEFLAGDGGSCYLHCASTMDEGPRLMFEPLDRDTATWKSIKRVYGKIICKKCNEGWMSVVENRLDWFKRIISSPAMSPFDIDEQRGANLARWAVLKAVVVLASHHMIDRRMKHPLEVPSGWARTLRAGGMPSGVIVESFPVRHEKSPLKLRLFALDRTFMLTMKVRALYVRVTFVHPDDRFELRALLRGDCLWPWRGSGAPVVEPRPHVPPPSSATEEMQFVSMLVPVMKPAAAPVK